MNDPTCPSCERPLRMHEAADGSGDQPKPGDVTVCLYCGEVLRFDGGLQLAAVSLDAVDDLTELERETVTEVRAFVRMRNRMTLKTTPKG